MKKEKKKMVGEQDWKMVEGGCLEAMEAIQAKMMRVILKAFKGTTNSMLRNSGPIDQRGELPRRVLSRI